MRNVNNIPVHDGSRMHVLDWVDSAVFLPTLREMVGPIGFCVDSQAVRQPQGASDSRESQLVDGVGNFLTASERAQLKSWWLTHQRGAQLPTWDLVVAAMRPTQSRALILVEAKAHATELCEGGKIPGKRATLEQQSRTDDNHARITSAIQLANVNLTQQVPGINLSINQSYQFANRIAWAWKMASMGIPVALVYLGFIGDKEIVAQGGLNAPEDWYRTFIEHTARHFPVSHLGTEIHCGAASFWLVARTLDVSRQSRPIRVRCGDK